MVSSTIKSLYSTIYSQAHSQVNDIIVAGNSDGHLLIYDVENLLHREESGGTKVGNRPGGPVSSLSVSQYPIYCLTHTNNFLIAGTTGAIAGWQWTDLKENESKPTWNLTLDTDQANFGTPEVNCVVEEANTLWAACGDWKTRAYDLETGKLVITLEGHKDYVHEVTASGNTVVSCGEDGDVLVWDCRAPLEPRNRIIPSADHKLARPQYGKYISSVDFSGDEWLVCGGGPKAAVYHLRSQSLVSTLPPNDEPVTVTKFTSAETASSLLTAGCDGGQVHVCNLSGQVNATLPTSTRCVYSVEISTDRHTLMSIGGYGNKIDMCLNLNYRDHSVSTVFKKQA